MNPLENPHMLTAALVASALAIVLAFLATPRQRWLPVLPAFPTRVTAVLAAIVALKGWTEALGAGETTFAWLTALMLGAIALPYCAARRRARR